MGTWCTTAPTPGPPQHDASIPLHNGVPYPLVGFGTAAMGHHSREATMTALQAGYRHLDTAQAPEWYSERSVGAAVQAYLWDQPADGVTRADLWLTTKLHARHHGYNAVLERVKSSLENLGTTYLDLFLLHHPRCPGPCDPPEGTWRDSWRALEELHARGTVRAIGVSNFDGWELRELVEKVAVVKPHVVQNWMDPFHQDRDTRAYCAEHGIAFTAYSSMGTQWEMRPDVGGNIVMHSPVLRRIAATHGVAVPLVVMSWSLQQSPPAGVIPRSTNPAHIEANLRLLGGGEGGGEGGTRLATFLSAAEVAEIDALDGKEKEQQRHRERHKRREPDDRGDGHGSRGGGGGGGGGEVRDRNPSCKHWAAIGECKSNPRYMLANCARSCARQRDEL